MEDYKTKYDKLHRFVNDLYPNMSDYCKEKVEGYFPELKENEEESIRKSIIKLLQRGGYMSPEDKSKAFAWLEKQGEQKPAWSEEDEKTLSTVIKEGDLKPSEIQWLKSLKDRMKGK